jgi:hypothetical protein
MNDDGIKLRALENIKNLLTRHFDLCIFSKNKIKGSDQTILKVTPW